jgi:hypothetical protein
LTKLNLSNYEERRENYHLEGGATALEELFLDVKALVSSSEEKSK